MLKIVDLVVKYKFNTLLLQFYTEGCFTSKFGEVRVSYKFVKGVNSNLFMQGLICENL